MNDLWLQHLDLIAAAPDGIKRLRELILELAVRGKLVPQNPDDEPASELLKRIQKEKARLVTEGKIKKDKPLPAIGEEEKPFELPVGWEWTRLAAAAFVNPRNEATADTEVSFVPMTMIGNQFIGTHQQETRNWGEVKQGFTHFCEGDVGVAKITPCFENSKACVFTNLVNGIGAGTTELHIIRPIANTLAPRYVLAYLKAPMFLRTGEVKMTGTAGQKRLPKDFVETNPFPLPPLPEQHRIVAKVDELMALCDQLEAREAEGGKAHATLVKTLLDTLTAPSQVSGVAGAARPDRFPKPVSSDSGAPSALERMGEDFTGHWERIARHFDTLFTTEASIDALKQTILQLAVMGKLVPQNPSDEPASELLKRIQAEKARLVAEGKIKKDKPLPAIGEDVKPFELPDGWAWVQIGEIADILGGKRLPMGSSFSPHPTKRIYIQVTNMKGGTITSNHLKYIDEDVHEQIKR